MEALTPLAPPIVELGFEAPQPVRRATVGFRIILAIPHLLFAALLSIPLFFAAFAGWWAALFTGRMPAGIGDFLGSGIRYWARLYAYLYLLTDTYPSFSLAEGYADPVTVLLPPRGRLNRAAVLFRAVIGIPAFIAISVIGSGVQLAMIVIWVVLLVSGRRPTSVFEALATTLRYQVRAYAWYLMLTSAYPDGLFGDFPIGGVGIAPPPRPDAPAGAVGSTPGFPGPGTTWTAPAPGTIPPPPLAPGYIPPPPPAPGYIPPPPPAPGLVGPQSGTPRITSLVLSKGGRRLVVTFIVLGVLLSVGQLVVSMVFGLRSTEAMRELDRQYDALLTAEEAHDDAMLSCGLSGGVDCAIGAHAELADALRRFEIGLSGIDVPSGALDEADQLRDDTIAFAALLDQLSVPTSDPSAYGELVARYRMLEVQVDDDYYDLSDALFYEG